MINPGSVPPHCILSQYIKSIEYIKSMVISQAIHDTVTNCMYQGVWLVHLHYYNKLIFMTDKDTKTIKSIVRGTGSNSLGGLRLHLFMHL